MPIGGRSQPRRESSCSDWLARSQSVIPCVSSKGLRITIPSRPTLNILQDGATGDTNRAIRALGVEVGFGMAIQFNCPYCTASIRVGDEAAGKVGKCPKCETKLRVPKPDVDAATEGAGAAPDEPESSPATGASEAFDFDPAPPSIEPLEPAETGAATGPVIDTTGEPPPSYASLVKKKRQGGGWWIGPVLFGGLLLAAAAGYWWFTRATMTGELTGVPIPVDKAVTAYVGPAAVDMPRREFMQAVEGLTVDPVLIDSTALRIEIRGSRFGLRVAAQAGPETELVGVGLGRHPVVSAFVAEHAAALNDPLAQELRTEATGFIESWREARAAGMELGNLAAYRDVVGLNALLGGLGYHTEAIYDGTIYPCVHEDADGALYYAVPRGTEAFVVRARTFEGRTPVISEPFEFTIHVDREETPTQPADSPDDAEAEDRSETQEAAAAPADDDASTAPSPAEK